MKYQKTYKPLNEKDKLRQFRELDNAFAKALRDLDDPESQLAIPTGPPVRSLDALEQEEKQHALDQTRRFQEQFHALMAESPLTSADFLALVETLLSTGHWQENEVPRRQKVANAS